MAAKLWRSAQLQRVLKLSTSSSAALSPTSAPSTEISAAAAAATASGSTEEAGRMWGFSVLVLLLPCAATFGLGSWQLVRRERKIELLDFRRARFEEDPIALEEALALKEQSADVLQYRKVYCEGVLDEAKSLFVGPRSRTVYGVAEKGYYMLTPFSANQELTEDWGQLRVRVQLSVLVNRGWVPSSLRNEAMAQEQSVREQPDLKVVKDATAENSNAKQSSWWNWWGKPQKLVVVEAEEPSKPILRFSGVIRDGEQPNMFVPNNQPEIGQWFYVDVPAMAQEMGLSSDVTYMEAVAPSSPDREGRHKFPLPKESDSFLKSPVMPQDHLNYALTWYTLSAATTFMAVKRLQSRKRGR